MKTTFLKSLAIVAATASVYATTVAFSAVESHSRPAEVIQEWNTAKPSTIEQWVTRRLGYPRLLDRSEQIVPVMIQLHVDTEGKVNILNCHTEWSDLAKYVTSQLNGHYAGIDEGQFNRDFEIKINFRPM